MITSIWSISSRLFATEIVTIRPNGESRKERAVCHSFITETRIKRFLFTSSAAVYGNLPDFPKKETSHVQPLTPYAVDKYASERFTIDYGRLYGLPTVAVRFFNVYGPRQNPDSPYSGVLSIITKCLRNDKMFTLYGDGSQTRDFVYVDDVVM